MFLQSFLFSLHPHPSALLLCSSPGLLLKVFTSPILPIPQHSFPHNKMVMSFPSHRVPFKGRPTALNSPSLTVFCSHNTRPPSVHLKQCDSLTPSALLPLHLVNVYDSWRLLAVTAPESVKAFPAPREAPAPFSLLAAASPLQHLS